MKDPLTPCSSVLQQSAVAVCYSSVLQQCAGQCKVRLVTIFSCVCVLIFVKVWAFKQVNTFQFQLQCQLYTIDNNLDFEKSSQIRERFPRSVIVPISMKSTYEGCLCALSTKKKSIPRAPFYPIHRAMCKFKSAPFWPLCQYKGGSTGSHESRLNELRVSVSAYYVAAIFCSSVKSAQ